MLERDELLKYPNFLLTSYQNEIYNLLVDYMEKKNLNQKELAKELEISDSYLSQVLNGEFNFTLKKVIELALKVGKVPHLEFLDKNEYWKIIDAPNRIEESEGYTIIHSFTVNVFDKNVLNTEEDYANIEQNTFISTSNSTGNVSLSQNLN